MHNHDPLQPHSHDPNPAPPSPDPSFPLTLPNGSRHQITVEILQTLLHSTVADCYIVSTGHGTSGPFVFGGVRLVDFIRNFWQGDWEQAEVVSADGFGTRIWATEVIDPKVTRPILLAYEMDEVALTREQGLVRLIVPSEVDDALRQVKWVGEVRVLGNDEC